MNASGSQSDFPIVGRRAEKDKFVELLAHIKSPGGREERHVIVLHAMGGYGKTVLLGEFENICGGIQMPCARVNVRMSGVSTMGVSTMTDLLLAISNCFDTADLSNLVDQRDLREFRNQCRLYRRSQAPSHSESQTPPRWPKGLDGKIAGTFTPHTSSLSERKLRWLPADDVPYDLSIACSTCDRTHYIACANGLLLPLSGPFGRSNGPLFGQGAHWEAVVHLL